jgi:hypothetical protein
MGGGGYYIPHTHVGRYDPVIHILFDICFCDLYTMASTSMTNHMTVAIQLCEVDIL